MSRISYFVLYRVQGRPVDDSKQQIISQLIFERVKYAIADRHRVEGDNFVSCGVSCVCTASWQANSATLVILGGVPLEESVFPRFVHVY